MVNLDLHGVVDLLPDRAAESFSEWLKQHPEIATISRDRRGLYAEGATLAPRIAQQIADRFHLVLNLSATMERVLEERSASLSCLRLRMHPRSPSCRLRTQEAMLEPTAPRATSAQLRPQRRLDRYEQVVCMCNSGQSQQRSPAPWAMGTGRCPMFGPC